MSNKYLDVQNIFPCHLYCIYPSRNCWFSHSLTPWTFVGHSSRLFFHRDPVSGSSTHQYLQCKCLLWCLPTYWLIILDSPLCRYSHKSNEKAGSFGCLAHWTAGLNLLAVTLSDIREITVEFLVSYVLLSADGKDYTEHAAVTAIKRLCESSS